MNAIQLEFNIEDKNPEEMKLFYMQKQIENMHESMGKVRRKLFSELGEIKKLYSEIQKENEELKNSLKELKNQKSKWIYTQESKLFDLQEYQEAIC